MKFESKKIIEIGKENAPVKGCTISEMIASNSGVDVAVFSLGAHTDISAETYRTKKLLIGVEGIIVYSDANATKFIHPGELFVTEENQTFGVKSDTPGVYMELNLKEEMNMNEVLQSKEVVALKDLVPYGEGKIINMDLASNGSMKYVLMSFDEGTGLSEHAAPAEVLLTALDGEAIIGYEGEEYILHAGESFKFEPNGRHYVKALKKFKMSLLFVM